MKLFLYVLLVAISNCIIAQTTVYSGSADEQIISFTVYAFSDDYTAALSIEGASESPLKFVGKLTGETLVLVRQEKNIDDTIIFHDFDPNDSDAVGEWKSKGLDKKITINLKREISFEYYDSQVFESLELLQPESTNEHYFKFVVSQELKKTTRVKGLKIYNKANGTLEQEISLNCDYSVINRLNFGDFNFDGVTDISIFEASYTGLNSSHIYILRDPKNNEYFVSNYEGVSLEFDYKNELIYERNSCCMGNEYSTAKYRVENNEMVLISEECFKYDTEKEDFIQVKCG
tara:strand:+ start:566 stop:1432 length:867 start_codon:yes stop_codon:yes gene_type:complete